MLAQRERSYWMRGYEREWEAAQAEEHSLKGRRRPFFSRTCVRASTWFYSAAGVALLAAALVITALVITDWVITAPSPAHDRHSPRRGRPCKGRFLRFNAQEPDTPAAL